MAAFLQLYHADDAAILLRHQDVVVTLQACSERIGGGDTAERSNAGRAERGATAAVNAARHTALIAGRSSMWAGRILGMQRFSCGVWRVIVAGCLHAKLVP